MVPLYGTSIWSLQDNKFECSVRNEGSFKVHDMLHDFWENVARVQRKSQQGTRKFVDQNL